MINNHNALYILLVSMLLLGSCSPQPAVTPAAETQAPTVPSATVPIFSTATPVPTITPFPTRTPTSTPEPTSTSLPLPTAEPVTGYARFQGKGMEIWLPDSYIGGNLDTDLDIILANIQKAGSEFNATADLINRNRELFSLWAFDQKIGNSRFMTNVNVIRQTVLSSVTLQIYTEANAQSLPSDFKVTETSYRDFGPYKGSRMLLSATIQNIKIKEAIYILQDGATMWVVTYGTSDGEFEERLPSFEKSIETFRSKK